MDFGEDILPFGLPEIALRLLIPQGEIVLKGLNELANTGEASVSDRIPGNIGEEALDPVQPGTAGGREVNTEARVPLQPGLYVGVFVGGVIVDDRVESQVLRSFAIQLFEESQPLRISAVRVGTGYDFAVRIVQCGGKRDRPVSIVIVGPGSDMPRAQGQARPGALQGLTLALLVAAQHQRLVRRIQAMSGGFRQSPITSRNFGSD